MSNVQREIMMRLLLGRTDLSGVSDGDIAVAEAFAASMGIQPYWIEIEPAEAAVVIDPTDVVEIAKNTLAFVQGVIAASRKLDIIQSS